jgi:hypothetical protein
VLASGVRDSLFKSGGSYHLRLKRPILSMMGIDPEVDPSIELTAYGAHIMLGRPNVTAPVPREKQASELIALVSELSTEGMGDADFLRLSADGHRRFRVLADAEAGRPVNQVTVVRLRRCLERVAIGETMEDAIAGTLVEFPGTVTSDSKA